VLDLSHNQITEVLWLPPGLKELNLSNNQIKVLCELPPGLEKLTCTHNPLESLPGLPLTLKSLTATFTKLKTLPSLPPGLTYLECSGNQLESLPDLPRCLTTLSAGRNQLKTLPVLPEGLLLLSVSYNQLTRLLPSSTIRDLDASYNQIAWISQIPLAAVKVDLSNNRLKALPDMVDCVSLMNLSCNKNLLDTLPTPPPLLAGLDDFRFRFNDNPLGYTLKYGFTVGDFVAFLQEQEQTRSYERTVERTEKLKTPLLRGLFKTAAL